MLQEPIEALEVAEIQRKNVINQLYQISDGHVQLISAATTPNLAEPLQTNSEVFVSYTVRDQIYVDFVQQSLVAKQPNVTFNGKMDVVGDMVQIERAQCVIIFLSSNYLRSEKEVDEFNLILSKQRTNGHTNRQYVILLDDLPPFPTYFHLVCIDTSITDAIWKDSITSVKEKGGKVLDDSLTKIAKNVSQKYGKVEESHVLALSKVTGDVVQILQSGR